MQSLESFTEENAPLFSAGASVQGLLNDDPKQPDREVPMPDVPSEMPDQRPTEVPDSTPQELPAERLPPHSGDLIGNLTGSSVAPSNGVPI